VGEVDGEVGSTGGGLRINVALVRKRWVCCAVRGVGTCGMRVVVHLSWWLSPTAHSGWWLVVDRGREGEVGHAVVA
jgi:hypothetical protein